MEPAVTPDDRAAECAVRRVWLDAAMPVQREISREAAEMWRSLTPEQRAQARRTLHERIDAKRRVVATNVGRVERGMSISLSAKVGPLKPINEGQTHGRLVSDDELRVAHQKYMSDALSMSTLANDFCDRFSSNASAVASLRSGFKRLGLRIRTAQETWHAQRTIFGATLSRPAYAEPIRPALAHQRDSV